MATQCTLKPLILDKDGNEIESRLFNGLLTYTNRGKALDIYYGVCSEEFHNQIGYTYPMDENGEYLPDHIALVHGLISEKDFLTKLDHKYGRYDRNGNVIQYGFNKASQTAKEFNKTNSLSKIVQMQVNLAENGRYHVKIIGEPFQKANIIGYQKQEELQYNKELNTKIREILSRYGIAPSALTLLEKRMGVSGVMDPQAATKIANGIQGLIRLADGIRGEVALPEEFAHFIVEALGPNDPFVNRLLNIISKNDLIKDILGDSYENYNQAYQGNQLDLSREALGQLLNKYFLQGDVLSEDTPYKGFMERFLEYVKNFLHGLGVRGLGKDIHNAEEELTNAVKALSSEIFQGNILDKVAIKNIDTSRHKLYSVEDRIQNEQKILEKIINTEIEKFNIERARHLEASQESLRQEYLDELDRHLEHREYQEGMYKFLNNTADELSTTLENIKNIKSQTYNQENINAIAGQLRSIKNYMSSYASILNSINDEMGANLMEDEDRFDTKLRARVGEIESLNNQLQAQYSSIARPLFATFLEKYIGNSLEIKMGKNKGIKLNIMDLLSTADKDITFFDRWLDAMSDSSDQMLRLFSASVEDRKQEAMLRNLDYTKRLQAAQLKLEKAGVKNTDFMFETDDKGNLTGRLISSIDYATFSKAKNAILNQIQEKYPIENLTPQQITAQRLEAQEWYMNNTEEIDGIRVPKKSIYGSNAFDKLNKAQKAYYDEVMTAKKELDALLPQGSKLNYKAVQIRRDIVERIRKAGSLKEQMQVMKENTKDVFMRREDDTEFGNYRKKAIQDFEGNQVMSLPIYFTRNLENMNDLSRDMTSNMIAYASMALDYDEMNKAINILEVGRDLMKEREIPVTEGGKPLVQTIRGLGRKFDKKLNKNPQDTYFMQKLNDYFDMRVYGRYIADEGNLWGTQIDQAKLLGFIGSMSAASNLAINGLAAISNITTGVTMENVESIAGQYFNIKDLAEADKKYGRDLFNVLSQVGDRVKTAKLSLFIEQFNVMQDYEQKTMEAQMDRKGISRAFHLSSLFFLNHCGEHWLQTRTALALSERYKLRSPTGQLVSLYDALEVVPFDGKDIKNGGKLKIKNGYTKEDGTAFTREDMKAFSNRSRYINGKMHGLYNKADMNAIQKTAMGRLCYQFRKWMRSSWLRRAGAAQYNYVLQDWTEGYYKTTFGFAAQLIKDLKAQQFNLMKVTKEDWANLGTVEKANIKRALAECGQFAVVCAALLMIGWGGADDDRGWISYMTEYQLRRLKTEIGSMTPTFYLPSALLQLVKSPAAGVNYIQTLLKILNFDQYFDTIQSGRYKGMTKGEAFWMDAMPMTRTLYNFLHPSSSIIFYKQGF